MSVVYNVPDAVKIENGKGLTAYVTLNATECKVDITKTETKERKKSNITRFTGGNNTSLSFNTDDRTAKAYITLRSNEDWSMMEEDIVAQVRDVMDQLIAVAK